MFYICRVLEDKFDWLPPPKKKAKTMKDPNILKSLLKERTLVLDGAMGTMIQKYKFSEKDYRGKRFSDYDILLKGNNDLLTLTQPQSILKIHREYLDAGADIIMTDTFSSTSIATFLSSTFANLDAIVRIASSCSFRVKSISSS